jgi:ribosomal protein L37AE/L43A
MICPFCESGELVSVGLGFARCGSCGLPLLGSALETLRDVIDLPDALGDHPCECGHPEMRRLPDGVYHCSACGSEVLPTRTALDPKRAHLGSTSAWNAGGRLHPDSYTSLRIYSEEG